MTTAATAPAGALGRRDGSEPLALLRRSMAPAPGRFANTLRLTILVSATVTASEVFRIPEPALSAYIVLFVSRGEAASTVMTAALAGIAILLAIVVTIVLFGLSLAEPALRIPLIAAGTFVAMFLSRTSPVGPVFFGAGFIIAYGLTLGDQVLQLSLLPGTTANTAEFALPELAFMPPEEALVHFLLWLGVIVSLPIALVIAANLFTGRDPALLLQAALVARLRAAAQACRREPGSEAALAIVAGEGTVDLLKLDHLSGLLHRRRRLAADVPALIRETDRLALVLLAWLRLPDTASSRLALDGTAAFCEAAERALQAGDPPATPEPVRLPASGAAALPLGIMLSRTVAALGAALLRQPMQKAGPKDAVRSPRRLLVADAFSNPGHARFAFKVTLAVMGCYAVEMLADWPAIHTCVITCFFVSLGTVGETVHKAGLRIVGCLIGGTLGIGAILLLMPSMTDLGQLLLVLAAVTFLGGWIANGSERIAYAGWQIALAFYIAVLQGYGPTLDMQTARDRVIGILLGNLVVFVVSTTIWPVRVGDLLRGSLQQAFRQFAVLLQAAAPPAASPEAARQPEAWHELGQAMGRAGSLLVNQGFEPENKRGHRIDASRLARLQAMAVPVSVICDLGTDPAWQAVPEPQRMIVLDYHRDLAAWFRQCSDCIGGRRLPLSAPPSPPDALLRTDTIPDAPGTAHLQARAAWYGLLDRSIRDFLDLPGPERGARDAAA